MHAWRWLIIVFLLLGCSGSPKSGTLEGSLALFRANGIAIHSEDERFIYDLALKTYTPEKYRQYTRVLQEYIDQINDVCSHNSKVTTELAGFESLHPRAHQLALALQVIAHASRWDINVEPVTYKKAAHCQTVFNVMLAR